MLICFALSIALQQQTPPPNGNSSPPSGDTVGYWQQHVAYTIVATLDEAADRVRARAVLRYVNNSPDTLREMYVHQYLNAFRPGSAWSAIDEREGRERFQRLRDPDNGYERFTAPVRVGGTAVRVDYPGAPDSTVAHFLLPAPLAPHDSVIVEFAWDARPSTLPRRQGRRGRHWDLAQWYPKIAVYDRAGWEHNALQPAGEFYGEYGTYDVTLLVRDDQIVGATGVPVSGDPGWRAALRAGTTRDAARAYRDVPTAPTVMIPSGHKAVRFVARDVHHFAWSASPNYRYEGGLYIRPVPSGDSPAWDTVAIHVLYQPGDDSTWGGLRAVTRVANALRWLESVYGTYAYPQMTVLHRLDGGGTEFPMMQMNGSASQGLILHEGGHVFTYGILGNNEWRSGWMDEGLTSYQTSWAEQNTAQEFARLPHEKPPRATGYRGLAVRPTLEPQDALGLSEALTDLAGEAQPIGIRAQDFRDFNTYNGMIYDRAEVMYGQLRDAIGDSAFVAFLHDYYARWKLKHVDERAMRASAEHASGQELGWFFDQWVHHTGVTDYAIKAVRSSRGSDGRYITDVEIRRRAAYRHPIAVGVRTAKGWTIAYARNPNAHTQVVRVVTADAPADVRLDPMHTSWDWNRLNDVARPVVGDVVAFRDTRWNMDWPFLEQVDREREVVLVRPMAWYSDAGGANVGVRLRSSYLDRFNDTQIGIAMATRTERATVSPMLNALQYWARIRNPILVAPLMGWTGGVARLDQVYKLDIGWQDTLTTLRGSRALSFGATFTQQDPGGAFVPELWSARRTADISGRARWRFGAANRTNVFIAPTAIVGRDDADAYAKAEFSVGIQRPVGNRTRLHARVYAGGEDKAPLQRGLYVSAQDPIETFSNHWWRPAGAILKRPGVDWLPLGGAALRGYAWDLPERAVVAANGEIVRQLGTRTWARGRDGVFTVRLHGFADVASVSSDLGTLSDAGVGVSLSGRLYDRPIFMRIDSPFYVSEPALAIDRGHAGRDQLAPRWTITFNDIW